MGRAGMQCKTNSGNRNFYDEYKIQREKYSPFILKVDEGNCRINPSLRIIINDCSVFQYLLLFETKKLLDFQHELLIFLFYLELEFLALDVLLYLSENK